MTGRVFTLDICSRRFDVDVSDATAGTWIGSIFGGLHGIASAPPTARFEVRPGPRQGSYQLTDGSVATIADDAATLTYALDKAIILALQHARPDLFFLHAAAFTVNGRAAVVVGPAGAGKTTLALASMSAGLHCLSDELVPVDLRHLTVAPYRRALCLKNPPPPPLQRPAETLDLGSRAYVPIPSPAPDATAPFRLALFAFPERRGARGVSRVSAAATAARLLSNALNPAAHPNGGLDAAVSLASRMPGYMLDTSDLPDASLVLRQLLLETVVPADRSG